MISYQNIYGYSVPGGVNNGPLGDINRFKRVDREGFNVTDNVDIRFFKLLFYFINDDIDNTNVPFYNGGSSGLLAPTWLDNVTKDYYKYNSAWAYLKNNYEDERADALEKFICLLSEISSESPWYFQSVSGVDEALAREKWQVDEERKKISIKCLNDPVDHRIESLLSLYRSIVWSHARKCEVLPANLRKFDMGLFVFSGLINGLIVNQDESRKQTNWAKIGYMNNDEDRANYKYIEFHNCEISADSIKSGFGEMSNETGFEQGFTIDIYFDDCYEYEYNPFIMRSFGDFFIWDAWYNQGRNTSGDVDGNVPTTFNKTNVELMEESTKIEINDRLAYMEFTGEDLRNRIAKDISSGVVNMITGGLGNIYGKCGGLMGAADAIQQEVTKQVSSLANKVSGNINDTATKISKSITGAIIAPVMGTIKKTGTMVGDAVDDVHENVIKPQLGHIKESSDRVINDFNGSSGVYTRGESDNLGNIYYGNQIGVNRLEQLNKNK